MAPTVDDVFEVLERTVAKAPDCVWEHKVLVETAWRALKSSAAAVERRMDTLFTEGRLARVAVFPSGYVRFEPQVSGLVGQVNFRRGQMYSPGDTVSWGTLSLDRPQGGALWAGEQGRYYFTTADALNVLCQDLLAGSRERHRRSADAQATRQADALKALGELVADGPELMERLNAVLGDAARVYSADGKVEMVRVAADGDEKVRALFDILRRGLV